MPTEKEVGDTIFQNEDENPNKTKNNSKPVARYKISPLTLTVFKRKVDGNIYHETNLQRTYPKDDQGNEFGYTESLRPRDLRKAQELFRKAANDLQKFSKENVE